MSARALLAPNVLPLIEAGALTLGLLPLLRIADVLASAPGEFLDGRPLTHRAEYATAVQDAIIAHPGISTRGIARSLRRLLEHVELMLCGLEGRGSNSYRLARTGSQAAKVEDVRAAPASLVDRPPREIEDLYAAKERPAAPIR